MPTLNQARVLGLVTERPQSRTLQNGSTIVNFTVATSDSWVDRETREKRTRTEFHRVVVFDKLLCKYALDRLVKHSPVYVEGQLQTRHFTGADGIDRASTEVVLGPLRAVLLDLAAMSGRGERLVAGALEEAVASEG